MDSTFWHERWRQNQIGFHLTEVNPRLVQWAHALPQEPGSRVLVPLCGKSHDLDWLAAQGYQVTGVELSPIAVRAFFEERGLTARRSRLGAFERFTHDKLELLCGDFFALDAATLGHCDGFYDRAALVALPEPMRDGYVKHLASLVRSGGHGLLVTFEYSQAEMAGPPFSIPAVEVHARYAPSFELDPLAVYDILAAEPRFAARGLTRLEERVYGLQRK